MGKQQTRHRPAIHALPTINDEFRLCQNENCRNVIALWLKTAFCSRCQGRSRGRKVRR